MRSTSKSSQSCWWSLIFGGSGLIIGGGLSSLNLLKVANGWRSGGRKISRCYTHNATAAEDLDDVKDRFLFWLTVTPQDIGPRDPSRTGLIIGYLQQWLPNLRCWKMRGKASQSCKSRFKASYFKLGFLAELFCSGLKEWAFTPFSVIMKTGVGCAAVLLRPLTRLMYGEPRNPMASFPPLDRFWTTV